MVLDSQQDLVFTIALDGPAAAGKGTIAKALAREFGFAHLDTGLLYRAVGFKFLQSEGGVPDSLDDAALARAIVIANSLNEDDLADESRLRTAEAAEAASKMAAIPEVRAALLAFQKTFARRKGGAVLDGRDIGTVVVPNAEAKLFVTANAKTRAERRFDELKTASPNLTFETVLADIEKRDARDAARDIAPMKQASDALLLDTTNLSIDAALREARDFVNSRLRAAYGH